MAPVERVLKPKAQSLADRRLTGVVIEWNDERGFGWLQGNGERVFAHIKQFGKGRRPLVGDEVTYLIGLDAQGRKCARNLRLVKPERSLGAWTYGKLLLMLLLPISAGIKLPISDWMVPGVMLVMSTVAWFLYGADKSAATSGRWRISESMLHSVAILGGWAGAYLAQQKFRHKTRKLEFQVVFRAIVLLYQIAALDVILDHHFSQELFGMLKDG